MKILSDNHYRMPTYYKQRVTKKELQQILLDYEDVAIINGRLMHLHKKNLGAGIYEVWFEHLKQDEKAFVKGGD
jgi:hypothetical protein